MTIGAKIKKDVDGNLVSVDLGLKTDKISDAALEHLKGLTKLEDLRLSDTQNHRHWCSQATEGLAQLRDLPLTQQQHDLLLNRISPVTPGPWSGLT